MSVTSSAFRRQHTDLHPLTPRSISAVSTEFQGRKRSSQTTGSTPNSNPTIPSPSIVAARAYFLELTTPIGASTDALQRRRSLIESPRRRSTVSTENLEAQLEKFTFSPESRKLSTVLEAEENRPTVKVENTEQGERRESIESDDVEEDRTVTNLTCSTPQEVLRQVPFQYTHDHLRDWGYAYLGRAATADAFVNAVCLRRPSLAIVPDDTNNLSEPMSLVTIRARITPKGHERRPFLIQRQFNLEELRASIPAPKASANTLSTSPRQLRRSTRVRRQSVQPTYSKTRRRNSLEVPSLVTGTTPPLSQGATPIHIEYALHYLPVLAALMLSGHVRKGDSIDLPVPHPAAWHEVVTYIYTGSGSLTSAVRENILYLAGHA